MTIRNLQRILPVGMPRSSRPIAEVRGDLPLITEITLNLVLESPAIEG